MEIVLYAACMSLFFLSFVAHTHTDPHLFTICERQAYAISSILVNGILVCVFIIAQLSRREMKRKETKIVRKRVVAAAIFSVYDDMTTIHTFGNERFFFSHAQTNKKDPIRCCLTHSTNCVFVSICFPLSLKEKAKYFKNL